jgi:plastocyanin
MRILDFGLRILVALLLLTGCDPKSPEKPAAPPRDVSGNSVVRGKILFTGLPPVMKEIPNQPCHEGAPKLTEETVLVGAEGGLKNVLVTIEGIGPSAPKGAAPMLDQVHCRYTPHVLGVTVGEEMVIRSSDATLHNVHITGASGDVMNFGLTSAGAEKRLSFATPGVLRAKCDVHPWMSAYIAVIENPFFAVTGDDGSFEIKNVPAGSFKLVTWHEQYGRLEQPITCSDEKPAEVKLTYGKN